MSQPLASRRADIQGLRTLAVLLVVLFHTGLPVPGGFVGVDVFFVISGFVITAMLLRERATSSRIDLRNFYVRRFTRLTPALAVVVAFTMLVSIFVLTPFGQTQIAAKTALGALFFNANTVIALTTGGYFDAPAETNPLLNMWSLSVEEQFYLIFPLALVVSWWAGRRGGVWRATPIVAIVALAVISLLLACLGSAFPDQPGAWWIGFYSPVVRSWEFALGALLAFLLHNPRSLPRWIGQLAGMLGLTLVIVAALAFTGATPFPSLWTIIPVLGSLLLVWAGSQPSSWVSSLFSTRPFVRVGDWSYSIYLWHWPFIVFAMILWPGSVVAPVLAAVISFAPALLSHYLVEQRLRARQLPTPRRIAGFVLAVLVIPVTVSLVALVGANASWGLNWKASSTQSDHVAFAHCVDKPIDPQACTWNATAPGGNVLLAGDSQAYAIADGVISAASALNMSTTVSSQSGCPVGTLDSTGKHVLDCPSWQRDIIAFALKTRPTLTVIANREVGYANPSSGWRTMVNSRGGRATQAQALALYSKSLAGAVSALSDAGLKVLIVQSIPEAPAAQVSLVESQQTLWARMLPRAVNSFASPAGSALRARLARSDAQLVGPNVRLFDPVAALCKEGVCPVESNGTAVYLDSKHLTKAGAELLKPALESAMRDEKISGR